MNILDKLLPKYGGSVSYQGVCEAVVDGIDNGTGIRHETRWIPLVDTKNYVIDINFYTLEIRGRHYYHRRDNYESIMKDIRWHELEIKKEIYELKEKYSDDSKQVRVIP